MYSFKPKKSGSNFRLVGALHSSLMRMNGVLTGFRGKDSESSRCHLTDRNARHVSVKLGFLDKGSWKAKIRRDSPDSDTFAEHLLTEQRAVSAAAVLNLHLAAAGGAVMEFQGLK